MLFKSNLVALGAILFSGAVHASLQIVSSSYTYMTLIKSDPLTAFRSPAVPGPPQTQACTSKRTVLVS